MPACIKGLVDLKASLERWRGLAPDDDARARRPGRADPGAGRRARSGAGRAGLGADAPQARSRSFGRAVLELEYTLIPHGLHVVGEAPSVEQRVEMLQAVADASHGVQPERAVLEAIVARRRAGDAGVRLAADADARPLRELAAIDRLLRRITRSPASCMRSMAASCARRRAAICCARRRSCRPGATCTASIRSGFPAPSRCRTARGRRSG